MDFKYLLEAVPFKIQYFFNQFRFIRNIFQQDFFGYA